MRAPGPGESSSGSHFFCVRGLSVRHGKVEAVNSISLRVTQGCLVALIGPNGAGKTSLLNALIGLVPSDGTVLFDGEDITALPTEDRIDNGLCLVPERRELFGEMSVADNLLLGAYPRYRADRGRIKTDLNEVYALFPRLQERAHQLAGTLSGGERQMLALGRALMMKPRLLMLDEPSLGLAPLICAQIFQAIEKLKETKVSILLVEQNAKAALAIADYAYVLELGDISIEGPASDIAQDPRVIETYLGLSRKSAGGARR